MKGILVVAVALLIGAAHPARAANCGEGGPCPGLAAAFAGVVIGGIVEGSIAVGGIVTIAGGGRDEAHGGHARKWRIANVVFGTLNVAAGLVWTGFAAAGISPSLTIPFGVPHLAVGIGDFVVAGISYDRTRTP